MLLSWMKFWSNIISEKNASGVPTCEHLWLQSLIKWTQPDNKDSFCPSFCSVSLLFFSGDDVGLAVGPDAPASARLSVALRYLESVSRHRSDRMRQLPELRFHVL